MKNWLVSKTFKWSILTAEKVDQSNGEKILTC